MKRLFKDQRGAAALEFAFASTALMALVFGITEMGRMIWTEQVLQGAATETARCVAIGSVSCPAGDSYAVNAAINRGIASVTTDMVAITVSDPCGSTSGKFTKVVITYPYASIVPAFVPAPAGGLVVQACFPH